MSATDKGGRDEKGRFTKNNPGGPGNPFARQVGALRSALVNKVTPEDIEDIVIILLLKAKQGDLAAVKLLFSYVLGKPANTVDPDRLDEQEWLQFQRNVVPGDHVPLVIGACHAELANGMARVTIPPVQDGIKRQLADILAVDLPVPLDPDTQAQLDDMAMSPADVQQPDDEQQEPTPVVLPVQPATVSKPADRLDRAANPRVTVRAAERPKSSDDAERRHQGTQQSKTTAGVDLRSPGQRSLARGSVTDPAEAGATGLPVLGDGDNRRPSGTATVRKPGCPAERAGTGLPGNTPAG